MAHSSFTEPQSRRATRAVLLVTAAFFVLLAAVVFRGHVADYFFLFDDYALVGSARRNEVGALFLQALIGFYRPLTFLFLKAQSQVFGWQAPWGYALVSCVLHGLNAVLLGWLLRRLGFGLTRPAIASVLFFLSPWAGETVFWVSCQFDLTATFFMLSGLHLLLGVEHAGRPAARWGLAVAGLGCAFAALLCKEIGVVLPVLYTLTVLARPTAPGQPWRLRVGLGFALLALVGLYLLLRGRFLPALSGAYGGLAELSRQADLRENLANYIRSFWVLPFDKAWPRFRFISGTYAVCMSVFFATALLHWRRMLVLLAGFFVCLAPVLWHGPGVDITAEGRLVYVPSIPLVVGLALGVGPLPAPMGTTHRLRRAWDAALAVSLLGVLAFGTISLLHQSRMWRASARISRSVLAQVEPHLEARKLYIPNLPAVFEQGPFILKCYAFEFFFEGSRTVPPVRCGEVSLRYARRKVHLPPEAGGPLQAESDEQVLRLDLARAALAP
jgi:hypothetical protein